MALLRSAAALLLLAVVVVNAQVKDLDASNFDSVVDGTRGVFVEFFAPWCGHCKALAPEYEIAGAAFAKETLAAIAKVDCDAHRDVCSRFGVSGYPTLKFFPKGKKDAPEDYNGGRTADDIISFVNKATGSRAKVKKASESVVSLTGSTFDAVALNKEKDVLVKFYAPWCGHCKRMAPDYEKLANIFAAEPNVVVAKVDCDVHKAVCSRFDVSGFPTLKYFPKNNKEGEKYEAGRALADFVTFLNEQTGSQRSAEGGLLPTAGRIASLDELAKGFSVADKAAQATTIAAAQKIVDALPASQSFEGKVYLRAFKQIETKATYADDEIARVNRLLEGAITPAKADEFNKRKNILAAFSE